MIWLGHFRCLVLGLRSPGHRQSAERIEAESSLPPQGEVAAAEPLTEGVRALPRPRPGPLPSLRSGLPPEGEQVGSRPGSDPLRLAFGSPPPPEVSCFASRRHRVLSKCGLSVSPPVSPPLGGSTAAGGEGGLASVPHTAL